MEIIKEEFSDVVEAKKLLEEKNKNKELAYEQKICLDYLEKTTTIKPEDAKKLKEELSKIEILKPRYISLILNILPETENEVNALFSKEMTKLKKDEVQKIVQAVKNHA